MRGDVPAAGQDADNLSEHAGAERAWHIDLLDAPNLAGPIDNEAADILLPLMTSAIAKIEGTRTCGNKRLFEFENQ